MSLVDFDVSSSDDDCDFSAAEEETKQKRPPPMSSQRRGPDEEEASPSPSVTRTFQMPDSSSTKPEREEISGLPDALSVLLNSPTVPLVSGNDHVPRVAAAIRKRDAYEHPSSLPRRKLPKGNLPHSKNIPETVGGLLVPPQLEGRSNVATEDIGKLFVRGSRGQA